MQEKQPKAISPTTPPPPALDPKEKSRGEIPENNTANTNKGGKKKFVNVTMENFHQKFGRKSWTPYLTLKTEQEISPMKLDYELTKIHASRETRFSRVSPLEWTIKTANQEQSEKYLKIQKLNNIKVNVSRNEVLNYAYGTVSVPPYYELDPNSKDKEELLYTWQKKDPKVADLEIYKIKNRRKPNKPIQIIKIKYLGEYLPSKIPLYGEMRQVREHTPKAMQCDNCNRYGHTKKRCRGDPTCAVCAGDHPTNWNCKTTKCSNCGGSHHAKSKNCFHHEYFTYIKLLQTRTAMTYFEAKLEAKLKGYEDPTRRKIYSQAMRDEDNPAERTKNPKPVQTSPKRRDVNHNNTAATGNRYSILTDNDDEGTSQTAIENSNLDYSDIVQDSQYASPTLKGNTKKREIKNQSQSSKKKSCAKETEDIDKILDELEGQQGPIVHVEDSNSSEDEGFAHDVIQASVYATHESPMSAKGQVSESDSDHLDPTQEFKSVKPKVQEQPKTAEGQDSEDDPDFFDPTQENGTKKPTAPELPMTTEGQGSESDRDFFDPTQEFISMKPKATALTRNTPMSHDESEVSEATTGATDATTQKGANATGVTGKEHDKECGCHNCYQQLVDTIEELTAPKVYELTLNFVQNKRDSKVHHTPLNQCQCRSHLNTKMKEPAWLSTLARELNKIKDKSKGTINIKLNPEKRNPKMQL